MKRAYLFQPQHTPAIDKALLILASHELLMEDYDSSVCTGRHRGHAYPTNHEERALIQKNARAVRLACEISLAEQGCSGEDAREARAVLEGIASKGTGPEQRAELVRLIEYLSEQAGAREVIEAQQKRREKQKV